MCDILRVVIGYAALRMIRPFCIAL